MRYIKSKFRKRKARLKKYKTYLEKALTKLKKTLHTEENFLLITVISFIIIFLIFYLWIGKRRTENIDRTFKKPSEQPATQETLPPTKPGEKQDQPTTPAPITWTKQQLSAAVAEYLGISEEEFILEVEEAILKNDKYYLRGSVGEINVVGGYYLYAIASRSPENKTEISIVYINKDPANCDDLRPLSPPISWLTDCRREE